MAGLAFSWEVAEGCVLWDAVIVPVLFGGKQEAGVDSVGVGRSVHEISKPAFVEQLPVVKVEGAPNTLGGKAVRDVSYGTVQASKEEAPQTALEPAVEVVKQRAPTVKFGTSKKMAEAMVDERPVLQPNDELT
eukprot:gene25852-31636_t